MSKENIAVFRLAAVPLMGIVLRRRKAGLLSACTGGALARNSGSAAIVAVISHIPRDLTAEAHERTTRTIIAFLPRAGLRPDR